MDSLLLGSIAKPSPAAFNLSKLSAGVSPRATVFEEELRSDPAYLSYYYSHVNLNPRLSPPLLSKEDWRFAQELQGGSSTVGGIGDKRKVNKADTDGSGRSMFATPPGFNSKKEEREMESDKGLSSADWSKDGLIGLPGIGLGTKQKSFAEIFQDNVFIISNPKSKYPMLQLDIRLISDLVVVIVSATCGGIAFACAGQPVITGYLLAGSVIGPGGFNFVSEMVQVETVAQFGVIFLLFALGLEFSTTKLRVVRSVAILGGLLQILLFTCLSGITASDQEQVVTEGFFSTTIVSYYGALHI